MSNLSLAEHPQRFLEVAHHTVSWFWSRLQNEELDMKPPYQRNPVWQESQKALLIDSVLRGYPIPELYLQSSVASTGKELHVVVDGQQRVRACLEFISNKFALNEDSGGSLAGLKFEQLPNSDKRRFFEYKFVVRTLPELRDEQIREIFGRLNRNNVALNRQELRHATYWGSFISCMEDLAKNPFWVNSGIFTSNDIRRMLDVEYVSELASGALYGPQNKKYNLEKFYASFEEEFPDRERVENIFSSVLGELDGLLAWPTKLRWSRKVDFYSLFLTLANRFIDLPFSRGERDRISHRMVSFSEKVDEYLTLSDVGHIRANNHDAAALAYARGVRNSSDLGSRRTRSAALDSYLRGKSFAAEQPFIERRDPLQLLPSSEDLLSTRVKDDPDQEANGGTEAAV
ncbi:DUF262 domain-containing protein [Amycolatopsis sp. CA-230715]|uniref:DUF262 domain-containing protein n=1 Tax=Amycolatopsis sp. CA-230715 TaxID=2745196 RepID=UPI001C034CCE|nr:DUF262 domain-containing protein [Amycolatopsis sp. CA-230715]QWF82087.1 hypothetical protein HUW46_05524 [Amycolatopsis sp. CA-230715]